MPRTDAPRLCRVAGRTTWHIYHQRRRISTGCESRAEAEAVLARYLEGEARPKGATASISSILALYLANRADENVPGLPRLEWAHKPLARYFGEKPVEVINPDSCRAYLKWRVQEGVSAGTVRTELQALRAALNWTVKRKRIESCPEIWMPPRAQARDRWLTRDEAAALLAGCRSHHIRLFVTIALHTGARKSAILDLTWDKVDLERRLIDFTTGQPQTRKRRPKIPLNETLHTALTEAKTLAETDWVVEYAGGPVGSIKHGFRDACIRAGLHGVTPHVIRHTAATWMAQAGVSLWDIAGFLGHTNPEMVASTYGHWHPDYLQKAAKALG